jgi:hypothetical protein
MSWKYVSWNELCSVNVVLVESKLTGHELLLEFLLCFNYWSIYICMHIWEREYFIFFTFLFWNSQISHRFFVFNHKYHNFPFNTFIWYFGVTNVVRKCVEMINICCAHFGTQIGLYSFLNFFWWNWIF